MKKILTTGFVLLTLFSGCSKQPQHQKCQIDNTQAPAWICTPQDTKEYITAVGSAQKNSAGDFQFQKEEAMAAARDALARRISVKVKNMFKQFKATTGAGDNQTFEKATESVSKQVAYQTIQNSKQLDVWVSPKGTMFVLIGVPKEEVKNQIKTSLQNNEALYQKFLAKKAQEELNEEIENEFK
jgi:hypothetical protein